MQIRIVLNSPQPIDDALVNHVPDLLAHAVVALRSDRGFHSVSVTGRASEPHFDSADGRALRGRVRELAAAAGPVDSAVVWGPLAEGPPALVVSDVDSTLIDAEVIELLAEAAGSRAEVAEVTERAMRGELDFTESLTARVSTLAGLDAGVFAEVAQQVRLSPGAAELVEAVQQSGGAVGLVSGGFIEVVGPLAESLGIDLVRANSLEVSDGRLTGRTTPGVPVVDRAAKAEQLRRWAEQLGIDLGRTAAIGDGANDLDMLATAGLGIAYCAKPVTAEAAEAAISFPSLLAAAGFLGL